MQNEGIAEQMKDNAAVYDQVADMLQQNPLGTLDLGEGESRVIKPSSRAGPAKFLEGYKGHLQADAYSAYDASFKPERG